MKTQKTTAANEARRWLFAHVQHQGNECLKWPYFIDPLHGRGKVGHNGRPRWVHRVMCELAHGAPPSPLHQAAHACGKGHEGCVNPRHLSWKTPSENCLDRRQHGTAATNRQGRYTRRLTSEQIAFVRAAKGKVPLRVLSERLGMSLSNIRYWQGYREKRMALERTAQSRTEGRPT